MKDIMSPTSGKLYPLRHHAAELLIRVAALGLIVIGITVISLGSSAEGIGAEWGVYYVIGSLLILCGIWIDWQRSKWMVQLPARCPNCDGVMDTVLMVWEEPDFDNSPSYYTEYRCRSCQHKCTNDFAGKLFYGWPPKAAYEAGCSEPLKLSNTLKTLAALLVMLGVIALLYWLGWVGNEECKPSCY